MRARVCVYVSVPRRGTGPKLAPVTFKENDSSLVNPSVMLEYFERR